MILLHQFKQFLKCLDSKLKNLCDDDIELKRGYGLNDVVWCKLLLEHCDQEGERKLM
jgi:hypothetical protein